MKTLLPALLAAILAGCASRAVQTERLVENPGDRPQSARVAGVPFVEQSAGHCGPAALTMALNWAGRPVSIDQVSAQVYTPGMKGSLQADLIGGARRNGVLAIPLTGLEALLTEVAAGHPVIVFENLALPWLPRWHYAVVFGYDLPSRTVLMHSGPEESKIWDLEKFERSWMLGDYWGLVLLPPDRLAAGAGESAHAAAAAGLEQAGRTEEASVAYRAILAKWPDSLVPLVGLGNIAYAEGDFRGAVSHLKRAVAAHPRSSVARDNLATAEEAARAHHQ